MHVLEQLMFTKDKHGENTVTSPILEWAKKENENEKKVYRWLTIALLTFVCIDFTACKNDDEENGSGTLIGSWLETRIEGWEMDSRHGRQDLTEDIPANEASTLTFKEDGTYTEVFRITKSGTYTYDASAKKITLNDGHHTETFNIESLTESKLVLIDDNGSEGYQKTIYRRQ